jgi:hypothetical protein
MLLDRSADGLTMPSERQVDPYGNPRLDAHGRPPWSQIVDFANRDAADKFPN